MEMLNKIKISVSAFQLKIASLVLFIIGRSLIRIGIYGYDGSNASAIPFTYYLGYFLTYTALPMIAFLTVEAVLKTRSLRQLFTRLGFAAVITELLLDLSAYGLRTFDLSKGIKNSPALSDNPNLYFTLIAGSVAVCIMERFVAAKFSPGSVLYVVLNILTVLVCCAVSQLLGFEHGIICVLFMAAFYFLQGKPALSIAGITALQLIALGSVKVIAFLIAPIIGTLPIVFYKNEEGYKNGAVRLLTYIAFPLCYSAVLLILRFGPLD